MSDVGCLVQYAGVSQHAANTSEGGEVAVAATCYRDVSAVGASNQISKSVGHTADSAYIFCFVAENGSRIFTVLNIAFCLGQSTDTTVGQFAAAADDRTVGGATVDDALHLHVTADTADESLAFQLAFDATILDGGIPTCVAADTADDVVAVDGDILQF